MRIILAFLLAILPLCANTRLTTSAGQSVVRGDYENVQYLINREFQPGAKNADGNVIITPDSDPVAALKAAAAVWNGSGFSLLHFAEPQLTDIQNNPSDGRYVFVIADTPETRSLVGGALAISLTYAIIGTGAVVDADIVFNPNLGATRTRPPIQFSTNGEPGTYDIESIATHELGHTLGAGHSQFLGAVMYPSTGRNTYRSLSSDDRAFLRNAYPSVEASANFGGIFGNVTLPDGSPARAVIVNAVDPETGVHVGALSNRSGSYLIGSVPPGNYVVYVEPLDGPVEPADILRTGDPFDVNFETTFFEGTVKVEPRVVAGAPLQLKLRRSGNDIDLLERGKPGGTGDHYGALGIVELSAGESIDLLISPSGFDPSPAAQVEFLGPGISLRRESVRMDNVFGFPYLRFTVDVTSPPQRTLVTLVLREGENVWTYSGAFIVTPGEPITFSSNSIVNAALLTPGPLAPDSWVSLFAPNLARELVVAPPGPLPTRLGGTSVYIDYDSFEIVPARLQFVSPNQLNFLMPAGLPSREVLIRVVSAQGGGSTFAVVNRVAPGIFAANADGRGPAAAAFLKVPATGERTSGFTFRADVAPRVNLPIDLGAAGDQVYLTFYGTGLRGHVNPVTASVGSVSVPVLAAVAQGEFAGLDQINIGPLPRTLAGAGEAAVTFNVDGKPTNPVTINIR